MDYNDERIKQLEKKSKRYYQRNQELWQQLEDAALRYEEAVAEVKQLQIVQNNRGYDLV